MAITNEFSITYGAQSVGGASSTYLLDGPYTIDRSVARLRLGFDVVVVASSFEELQSLAATLEDNLSKRDQSVSIDIAGNAWDYTFGTSILNSSCTITKTGSRERDRGFSRGYTCVIEGDLPATDQDGLRELEVHVATSPSRQRTVTMRGIYSAMGGDSASTVYAAEFDARAAAILTSIDSGATWELVQEESSRDRLDHLTQFQRAYLEILLAQVSATTDDPAIVDHRVSFTDYSQHPGDSQQGAHRLRKVTATYDCAIDSTVTKDLATAYNDSVMPHLIDLFVAHFSPRVYGIDERRASFDRSGNRISVSCQFTYQKNGGTDTVEVTQSTTTRETRTIDYTPVHNGDELGAYVDPGFMVKERIYSLTSMVVGHTEPTSKLSREPGKTGAAAGGGAKAISTSGWNTVQSTVQVTTQWIGDPDFGQIQVSIVSESRTDRYSDIPLGRA